MNPAEHPLALDIERRLLAAVEDGNDYTPATVLLPGMPNLMGELRSAKNGLYRLTTNVKLEGGTAPAVGRVDFMFSPDKAVAIVYPTEIEAPEASRIVSPH